MPILNRHAPLVPPEESPEPPRSRHTSVAGLATSAARRLRPCAYMNARVHPHRAVDGGRNHRLLAVIAIPKLTNLKGRAQSPP